MTQAVVIAIVVSIALADELAVFPVEPMPAGWGSLGVILAPFLAIVVLSHVCIRLMIARSGRVDAARAVRSADRFANAARGAVLAAHFGAVFWFGLAGVVREMSGDWVLIDEAIVAIPALLSLAMIWVALYPVDRMLASLGGDARRLGLLGVVGDHIRHDMLLYLVPIGALVGWSEWIDRGGFGLPSWGDEAARWVGIAMILCCAPFVLRVVWRTGAFPEGELRDRLEALARSHGVRYHALRVWRPRAPVANAAVIGPVWFSRIILISETLLGRLPDDQIEAVMAHEVAHARRRHLPWMMIGVLSMLTLAWAGAWWVMEWLWFDLIGNAFDAQTGDMLMAGALVPSGIGSLLMFGFISRRFEYQADAFAAAQLSSGEAIDTDGADTMAHALLGVAHLNHIPIDKRTFRHGSIEGRVARLYKLPGARRWRAPIDRRVAQLKIAILMLTLGMVVWMALGG